MPVRISKRLMVKTCKSCRVILASASPRRKQLLGQLVKEFDVAAADIEEVTRYKRPHLAVMDIASQKCAVVGAQYACEDSVIIAADTAVVLDGKFYAKPKDEADAARMLRELSGRRHRVYTGVAVLVTSSNTSSKTVFYDVSEVLIKKLGESDIAEYISSGSPMDKAGAYGIQDGFAVQKYKGSYSNIMGLPIEKLQWLK